MDTSEWLHVEVVRTFFDPPAPIASVTTEEDRRCEARRQLLEAKAILDSTLHAVLMACPDALDGAYVQSVVAVLMRTHKAARGSARPLEA